MAWVDVKGSSALTGLSTGGNKTGATYAPVTGISPTIVMIGAAAALVVLYLVMKKKGH